MYIKIVGKSSMLVGEIREVTKFQYQVRDAEKPNFDYELWLNLDGEEKEFSEDNPVTVYVMNEAGHTIDKIVFDPVADRLV